jgi:LacI family transcriptional regulator
MTAAQRRSISSRPRAAEQPATRSGQSGSPFDAGVHRGAPTPTLQTIATHAGVSSSTASRALHGHPLLAKETIHRVRAAAKALGYHANPLLSNVMRGVRARGRAVHLGAIAYLTFHDTPAEWRDNPTYNAFFEGARDRAHELAFSFEPVWAGEPGLNARRLTTILRNRGVAGVIVGPRPSAPTRAILDWDQFSIASVGRPLPGMVLHQAASHYLRTMERLLAALSNRGYQRIGLALSFDRVPPTDHGWLAGFSLYQQTLPPPQRVPIFISRDRDPAAFRRWITTERPDVLIGQRADLVDQLLPVLGFQIPDELGYALLSRPDGPQAPAGMNQLPALIGSAATDLVANQIACGERGPPRNPRFVLIEGEWTDGPTVRPL